MNVKEIMPGFLATLVAFPATTRAWFLLCMRNITAPRIQMRRVPCSGAARTETLLPLRRSAVKKSRAYGIPEFGHQPLNWTLATGHDLSA